MKTKVFVFAAVVAVVAMLCSPAMAQPRYTPSRPTFSPWLNLYQRNTGVLDNYHTYVRPQVELERTLRQQDLALSRQSAALRNIQGQLNRERPAQAGPTGVHSTFMNYSHYYPGASTGGLGARSKQSWTPRPSRGSYYGYGGFGGF